ncbi:trans-Golgi network integral membrane protein TGN38-like, partial [Callorhinchus milii]
PAQDPAPAQDPNPGPPSGPTSRPSLAPAKPEVLPDSAREEEDLPVETHETSHFLTYLVAGSLILAALYIVYHSKHRIIALCHKRGPKQCERPNKSDYMKLDQNLSEVITSLKKKVRHSDHKLK